MGRSFYKLLLSSVPFHLMSLPSTVNLNILVVSADPVYIALVLVRSALSLISCRHRLSLVSSSDPLKSTCQTHDITVGVIGLYSLITNLRCVQVLAGSLKISHHRDPRTLIQISKDIPSP